MMRITPQPTIDWESDRADYFTSKHATLTPVTSERCSVLCAAVEQFVGKQQRPIEVFALGASTETATAFLVKTDAKPYLLQQLNCFSYEDTLFGQHLGELLFELHALGAPVIVPISSNGDYPIGQQYLAYEQRKQFLLFPYNGSEFAALSGSHVATVGCALAAIHNKLENYQASYRTSPLISRFDRTDVIQAFARTHTYLPVDIHAESLCEKALRDNRQVDIFSKLLRSERMKLVKAANFIHANVTPERWYGERKQLIHGNFIHTNTVQFGEGVRIINFEKYHFGSPLYDIGAVVADCTLAHRYSGNGVDHETLASILQGYNTRACTSYGVPEALAYGLIFCYHRAAEAIQNMFINDTFDTFTSFERHVRSVGELMEEYDRLFPASTIASQWVSMNVADDSALLRLGAREKID